MPNERYEKSVPHYKDKEPVDPSKYSGAGATGPPITPIEIDEMHDILKSVGAFDKQVKNEKSNANKNKAKGYAKAKAIGKKYG